MHTIEWDRIGLLPVIAQDSITHEVLMLAYMNAEALELSRSTRIAHYYSRSKQRLWKKGESSGHLQHIERFVLDCDNDTLLIFVRQEGVACHTGRRSCFFTDLENAQSLYSVEVDTAATYGVVDTLYHTILERKNSDPNTSWTAKLFHKGDNAILKKVIEEAGEVALAVKDNDTDAIIYESADLLYHMLVALASKNISPDRIKQELARRFHQSGIAEKASRSE